jgi:hypothetical protein
VRQKPPIFEGMRKLIVVLACLFSLSVSGQEMNSSNTEIDNYQEAYFYDYDLKRHSNATAGKYIGFTTSIIGGAMYASRAKNGASQVELDNAVSIMATGALISFLSELIMDLQVLQLGNKRSVRKPSNKTSQELDVIRGAIVSKADGVYMYRNNKKANFIFNAQSKDTNNILIYFETETEIGEKWIHPMSDKLIWFNLELRNKFYLE